MQTLSYGYKKPEAGDRAKGTAGWYQAIEFDIERLNTHNHDGSNSAAIPVSSFTPLTVSILAAGWTADTVGYKQTVTAPAGVTEVNDYDVHFVFTAPVGKLGERAYLGMKRVTATTFEVYCNDNTAAFTAYFR